MNPNYRLSDPPTSRQAGAELERNGTARQQCAKCLAAVLKTPGLTAREIEDRVGIKAHKRLPELRSNRLVCNGRIRRCQVSGRQAMTWHPCRCHNHKTTENYS